jgi:Domain of unknown function (DUF5122) beta-propeller
LVSWPKALTSVLFCLLCVGGLTALAGPADAAPSNGPTGAWTLVGGARSVSATARAGDVVYFGGSFTGIARRAPGIASIDLATGVAAGGVPDFKTSTTNSPLRVVEGGADGSVYVAGPFVNIGSISQPRLARLVANGAGFRADSAFRPQFDGDVNDIAIGPDGTVYLAGSFTKVGGEPRNGLAAVDGDTGAVRAWNPPLSASADVREIELGTSGAYIVGSFTAVGAQSRDGLAQVSLATGAATAWNPDPNLPVNTIELADARVFLGGDFTTVNGVARQSLAAVSATGSGAVVASWDPHPDGSVRALEARGSTLYVSGFFLNIGGGARTGAAAVDTGSGAVEAWDPGLLDSNNPPTTILATDTRVFLGLPALPGAVASVDGADRCGLAAVSAANGDVEPNWDPQLVQSFGTCGGSTGGVAQLAVVGTRLWSVGDFDAANVQRRAGVAAIDVGSDMPLAWAPQPNAPNTGGESQVRALAVSADGAVVFMGGAFANVNGKPRSRAAAVEATGPADTAADVFDAWNPAPDGVVNSLALSPSGVRVYLAGAFAKLKGTSRPRLGWVSATTADLAAWAPKPDGNVFDIAVAPDGRVFAGGAFGHAGAQATQPARRALAAFDPTSGDATEWDAGLSQSAAVVDSVALADGVVYAGGQFEDAPGGAARSNAAAFDQASAAPTAWAPRPTGRVRRVSVAPDGTVYLLGSFASVDDQPRVGAASVTPAGTVTGWNPTLGAQTAPAPLQFVADRVIAGGNFSNAGARLQPGLAVFGPASPPVAAAPPRVASSGAVNPGESIACQPGTYTGSAPFTTSYQWLQDGAPISVTTTTYTVTAADANRDLSCRESAYNAAGEATQTSAAVTVEPLPPALLLPPQVVGEPWVGGQAICSTGLWSNAPEGYRYRWFLDGAVVPGATGRELSLNDSHLGHSIACEVTAENGAGDEVARSEPVVVRVAPPINLASPLVSGVARVGERVSCDPGSWSGTEALAFGWLRDGVSIPGEVASTLQLTSRDLGRNVACRVTARGPGGETMADSAPVLVQSLPRGQGSSTQPVRTPRVDLRQARVQANGSLLLKVAVSAAGTVNVEATTTVKSKKKKPIEIGAAARMLFGRATARPRRAGTVSIRLKPTARAKRALRRAGRRGLKVNFTVRLKPTGGGAQRVDRATVTIRAPAKR